MNRLMTGAAIVALGGGCATLPVPPALSAARSAQEQLKNEGGNFADPKEVDSARQTLQVAEDEAKRDPTTWQANDSAYLALRRSETALVHARQRMADAHRVDTEQKLASARVVVPAPAPAAAPTVINNNITSPAPSNDPGVGALSTQVQQLQQQVDQQKKAAADREAQLAADREAHRERVAARDAERDAKAASDAAALQAKEQQLADAKVQLEEEREARRQAERLASVAKVHQEKRGLVITLSGSVLFASGKSTLLPSARRALDQVGEALGKDQDREITIEGYTDSRGSEELNARLSEARAQAVLDYLGSHGLPNARLRARGMGPAMPVADNSNAEGRAMNRRVELIVSNPNRATGGSGLDDSK